MYSLSVSIFEIVYPLISYLCLSRKKFLAIVALNSCKESGGYNNLIALPLHAIIVGLSYGLSLNSELHHVVFPIFIFNSTNIIAYLNAY